MLLNLVRCTSVLMLLNLGQMHVCTDAVESRSDARLY